MAGIYIHIPFCHSKCAYCDFYSTPNLTTSTRIVDAIVAEYALRADEITGPVHTIYIGGGTPSILPDRLIGRLMAALPTDNIDEFTIEVNPEDVSVDRVWLWRDMGINRVSMGVQSLDDAELRLIGRRHTALQAIKAAEAIRQGGIDNISLDLIYALPSQTVASWTRSLEALLDLRPEHLSAYMLSYEPRTRLTAMLNAGKITPADEDTIVQMYRLLIDTARSRGYVHYEISNFAKPGYESKHNSSYWYGAQYLGLGPAAHSFDGRDRRVNPSDINAYLNAVESGKAAYETEHETRVEQFNDLVITRLRTARGLDFADVPVSRRRQLLTDAYPLIASGSILLEHNHLRIPEQQWLISDSILRDLIQ